MYIPETKEKKYKKPFFQKHPLLRKFFENFGCIGWVIIVLAIVAAVMFIVPSWRPVLFIIIKKGSFYWKYFWKDYLPVILKG